MLLGLLASWLASWLSSPSFPSQKDGTCGARNKNQTTFPVSLSVATFIDHMTVFVLRRTQRYSTQTKQLRSKSQKGSGYGRKQNRYRLADLPTKPQND